jgi:hypothetical protein
VRNPAPKGTSKTKPLPLWNEFDTRSPLSQGVDNFLLIIPYAANNAYPTDNDSPHELPHHIIILIRIIFIMSSSAVLRKVLTSRHDGDVILQQTSLLHIRRMSPGILATDAPEKAYHKGTVEPRGLWDDLVSVSPHPWRRTRGVTAAWHWGILGTLAGDRWAVECGEGALSRRAARRRNP